MRSGATNGGDGGITGARSAGGRGRATSNSNGATTIAAAIGSGTNGTTRACGTLRFKTNFRNTIYDTLLRRGWKETNDNDWDFYWYDREYVYELLDTVHLEPGQRVNHYRNGREVATL